MSRRILAVAAVAAFLSAPASAQTYTTFTVSGAAATIPVGIGGDGTVTGYYTDSASARHGFVRATDGTITTFDPSGSISTTTAAIDKNGTIVGSYETNDGAMHGFSRAKNGAITTIDVKNAQNTFAVAIHGKTIGSAGTQGKVVGYELSRGGRIDSPAGFGDRKKQLQMVTEGSVLVAGDTINGAAPDVAPEGFAHPVFRAGFALSIPLPRPNRDREGAA